MARPMMMHVTLSEEEQYTIQIMLAIIKSMSPREQVILAQLLNEGIVRAGNDVATIIGDRPLLQEAILHWARRSS